MEGMRNLRDSFRSRTRGRSSRAGDAPQPVPEEWPTSGDGPRVLIENADGAFRWAAGSLLERAGYEVASCGGPHSLSDGRCPLVTDGGCPLVDGADVVVNGLGIRDPAYRAVLAALCADNEDRPVVVELPQPQFAALHDDFPGCRTVPFPVRPEDLVAAVDEAVDM